MIAGIQATVEENGNGKPERFLDSLEVAGFRAFKQLRIERLGRVNLVVGKNSIGKSCLLEAIRLYAEQGSLQVLLQLLSARDEDTDSVRRYPNSEGESDIPPFLQVQHLFYGRKNLEQINHPIEIGPFRANRNKLRIKIGVINENRENDGPKTLRPFHTVSQPSLFEDEYIDAIPGLSIVFGRETEQVFPLIRERFYRPRLDTRINLNRTRNIFVSSQGLSMFDVDRYWDQIKLRDSKKKVLSALQIISSEIEDIDIFGVVERTRDRVVKVRIHDMGEPLPLRSMGDGLSRVFGLTVALVNASDGILLVDEIESGLHYSVQRDLWRLIFQTARQLNVQVFATTHSWDCIDAFQKAAIEDEDAEGMLIRLQRKGDEIVPISFIEKELAVVTREQIEIR